jgi:CubicO group peptidase (beta-lactamase class C family)
MKTRVKILQLLIVLIAPVCLSGAAIAQPIPNGAAIDGEVSRIMTETHANGMAVAVIDHGKVGYVHAYGIRNAKGDPLTTDTVMYGASLTKMVFAYTVMQLVDQGKLNLDTPLKDDLDKPLPSYGPDPVFPDKYGPYKDLAGDPRWEKITPRMCLTHSTGFSNFWFIEPDHKLHIHFEPGTRFSYSGEGFILLQFVIEHGRKAQGLGLDVGDLTKAIFDRLGMTRGGRISLPTWPMAGMTKASHRNTTSAAKYVWRARWTPQFPICPNSLPPWCAAMA